MKKFGVLLSLVVACGGAEDAAVTRKAESENRDSGAPAEQGGGELARLDSGKPEQSDVCDPLQARPRPIALGTVLAAGAAGDGTFYVVTHGDTRAVRSLLFESVFVSEGDTLVRREALFSESRSVDGDLTEHSVMFLEGEQYLRLVFQTRGSSYTRMALVPDNKHETYYDDSIGKIELTVLPASAVTSKPVRNLPGVVGRSYSGMTADGKQVLLTAPLDDGGAARVFFGRESRLQEAPITSYRPGGDRVSASFSTDGRQASVGFALSGNPEFVTALSVDPHHLEPLQLLGTGIGPPDSWTFHCL